MQTDLPGTSPYHPPSSPHAVPDVEDEIVECDKPKLSRATKALQNARAEVRQPAHLSSQM